MPYIKCHSSETRRIYYMILLYIRVNSSSQPTHFVNAFGIHGVRIKSIEPNEVGHNISKSSAASNRKSFQAYLFIFPNNVSSKLLLPFCLRVDCHDRDNICRRKHKPCSAPGRGSQSITRYYRQARGKPSLKNMGHQSSYFPFRDSPP